MMELITRTKLMIQLVLLFVISQNGNNLMVGTEAGEVRRGYISPYDTINKVSLTQKGYIQFLKYLADVPPLTEFTFCLWMRSDNLNFSHPLFSYSRNEKDRLIRVWVSDGGLYVNMAILEQEIFKIPLNVRENHWNHYCPSWNAKIGTWSFYYNGKLIQTGLNYKLIDIVIPGRGDIVVGQEYTDFDKGLDDGIEGDVYAFNLVASSTMPPKQIYQQKSTSYRRQMYIPSYTEYVLKPTPAYYQSDTPAVIGYFTTTTREPKGLMDFGQTMLKKLYNLFDMRELRSKLRFPYDLFGGNSNTVQKVQVKYGAPIKRAYKYAGNELLMANVVESPDKTLGLFLVEMSYDNCLLGRGAPLVDDKVIVSWTKTPVRVFGGAILKTVVPFCRKP